MKYRMLGRGTGLKVSEIALGTGLFGAHGGTAGSNLHGIGAEAAREAFAAFADAGGTFIDTAEAYATGESERLVGELVASRRDDFVIATKYGVGMDGTEGDARIGNGRKAMMDAIDGSLRRLQTDYIDLYWARGVDEVTPIEEMLQGLDDLIRAGKVRYGGLGSMPAWRVARAQLLAPMNGWAPVTAINTEYGIAERSAERELLPMAEALGIGFVAWSPLSSGFLSGADPRMPHWIANGRPTAADLAVREAVSELAARIGANSAQVGLAWVLRRARRSGTAVIPVLGADNGAQMAELLESLELELSDEDAVHLEAAGGFRLGEPHDHNRLSLNRMGLDDLIEPLLPVA